ncbi:MAG: hypothetical protein HQK76_08045 [Desulfobacterales bacterium]|nr:hypothetical protein [Desulfobacterales bacterium]
MFLSKIRLYKELDNRVFMKRLNNLYEQIYEYKNLREAFHKAVKGKHLKPEVIAFKKNFDKNMEKIRMQLVNRDVQVGNYYFFHIHDPKPRHVCAACFEERILHHAIMNICEPILDRYSIYDSYACRQLYLK